MLTTKPVSRELPDYPAVKRLLQTQFPRAEQMPIWIMLLKAKNEYVDFLAFYDNHTFVGFAYMMTNGGLTCVLYIAVDEKMQSRGYGSRMLQRIKEIYPHNRIVLNIETMDVTANNSAQRAKRRQFYIKNGFAASGMRITEGIIEFETLIFGGSCTIEEYNVLYKKFAGAVLYPIVKPRIRYTN